MVLPYRADRWAILVMFHFLPPGLHRAIRASSDRKSTAHLSRNYDTSCHPRGPDRAQGILLSAAGLKINEIATVYQVDRDTVATWIKKWEKAGIEPL